MSSIGNWIDYANVRKPLPPAPYVHSVENWDDETEAARSKPTPSIQYVYSTENWGDGMEVTTRKPVPYVYSTVDYTEATARKPLPPVPHMHPTENWDEFHSGSYDAEAAVVNKRVLLQPAINQILSKNGRRAFRKEERIRHARLKKEEEAAVARTQ